MKVTFLQLAKSSQVITYKTAPNMETFLDKRNMLDKKAKVRVNGKVVSLGYTLKNNDLVTLSSKSSDGQV